MQQPQCKYKTGYPSNRSPMYADFPKIRDDGKQHYQYGYGNKYDDKKIINTQSGIKHICGDAIKTAYKQKGCKSLSPVFKMKIRNVIGETQGADTYDWYYKSDDKNN